MKSHTMLLLLKLLPLIIHESFAFPTQPGGTRLWRATHEGLGGAPSPSASDGIASIVTTFSSGAIVDASSVLSNWSFASPSWSSRAYTSYALWGAGTFASYAWGSQPYFTPSYSCQGALITEKLLCLGGAAERNLVSMWLLAMPISAVGKVWEAAGSEWHMRSQGTWESSAEAIIAVRHAAAFGESTLLSHAPERLLCSSADGGKTWELAGVSQPGLNDNTCDMAPLSLVPLPADVPPPPAPFFYFDAPSTPHPGPSLKLENSGRILTQALRLTQPSTTHLSLPLYAKRASSTWPATVTIIDVTTSAIVGEAQLAPTSGDGFGKVWTHISVSDRNHNPLSPGLYLVVIALQDVPPPPGSKVESSFSLSIAWVSNGRPGQEGGAGTATYGQSTHWYRNVTNGVTRLASSVTLDVAGAMAEEVRRVSTASEQGQNRLGRSIIDYTVIALSWCLALASQVPVSKSPTPNTGKYDIFVIPDSLFRGSFEESVDSGCSYYDLLRIGFASSYINLRVLEAVLAYGELQTAGIAPSVCPKGSSLGIDNAFSLLTGETPCYTADDIEEISLALRLAIGTRFSDSTTGTMVDWWGCAAMGVNDGDVSACGLSDVINGTAPSGSILTRVASEFMPSLALAVKLGVPAGGISATATRAAFDAARVTASEPAPFYGGGWMHTNNIPLENIQGGAASTIASNNWKIKDAQGFAIRTLTETGDWHMFNASSLAAGGPRGYGQWSAQGENGGRFFTTTSFAWEALSSPLALWPSGTSGDPSRLPRIAPFPSLGTDWARVIGAIDAVGTQLATGDTSQPLLAHDRSFLSAPSIDPIVVELCTAVRIQAGFPNRTDAWGEHLCAYYQDLGWGTPENGVLLWTFIKGLLGAHVAADGTLSLLGQISPPLTTTNPIPWHTELQIPLGWPIDVAQVLVNGLRVRGRPFIINCTATSVLVQCDVSLSVAAA